METLIKIFSYLFVVVPLLKMSGNGCSDESIYLKLLGRWEDSDLFVLLFLLFVWSAGELWQLSPSPFHQPSFCFHRHTEKEGKKHSFASKKRKKCRYLLRASADTQRLPIKQATGLLWSVRPEAKVSKCLWNGGALLKMVLYLGWCKVSLLFKFQMWVSSLKWNEQVNLGLKQ